MRTTSSHYIRLHPEAHYQKTSRSRKLSYPDIAIWQMKYSMTWFHMGNRLSWKTVVKMQLGFQKIDVFACGACQLWVANFASNSLGIEGWRLRQSARSRPTWPYRFNLADVITYINHIGLLYASRCLTWMIWTSEPVLRLLWQLGAAKIMHVNGLRERCVPSILRSNDPCCWEREIGSGPRGFRFSFETMDNGVCGSHSTIALQVFNSCFNASRILCLRVQSRKNPPRPS